MAGNYFIKKLIDWYNLEIAAGVRRHRKDIRLFERGLRCQENIRGSRENVQTENIEFKYFYLTFYKMVTAELNSRIPKPWRNSTSLAQ
jgi:hypothetical protein